MGINIFLVVHKNQMAELPSFVDDLNESYGGDDEHSLFDWCDLFRDGRDDTHLLTIDEALNVPEGAEPWYVFSQGSDGWHSVGTNPAENATAWKAELERLRDDDAQVVFLKARV